MDQNTGTHSQFKNISIQVSLVAALLAALWCVTPYVLAPAPATPPPAMPRLLSVDFEVFGRVQGVFFRKHTQQAARRLGVVGWCRNTPRDTVEGQAQAAAPVLAEMKRWLREVGSPQSKIERAEFRNEREVAELDYQGFTVKH
ncbi:acylphosphatase-1-like [Pollicipes pollicipes]|uniref:acylphosphatase-1-like n=1 Tax=Pollicipes pollicipes TaxID=41117 RepID=UPI001885702B|nr:acylphosphatase-1-like [Pollicipes pollicipes]